MKMTIKEIKISDLKPADYNPRRLTEKQYRSLRKSLVEFGAVEPAVVNTHPGREGIIVGGHQRIRVWKEMGRDTYPCVEVNLPLHKEKELNVRLNRNTGEWDMDMLANLFDHMDLMDWGFEEKDLGGMTEVGGDPGGEGDGDGKKLKSRTCPHCGESFEA